MPQPGTLIEGKYEILGKIHEGGMGTIYKVRHRLLDEIRVVKVMKPAILGDQELKTRFAEEAKMATRLKHPNIGTIHDFALDDDGTAYLVMEFIDGVNLAELLHSKGPPGIPLVLEITHQALLALGYLHRRNVIHRDVAPDNLMLTQDDEGNPRVKLIDLGIAKALDRPVDLTSTGVFLGKLKYASPEQYGSLPPGEKLDGRSDLYCLGVVIYELLTERRPFVGETPAELLRAHLFNPPTPFEESDPEGRVPPDLRKLVFKSLEKKREDRFETAEEFDREIIGLRHRYGEPGTIDPTVQLLSTVRQTPGATEARTITPSAQGRIDRQFLAGTTPSARRSELSEVPRRPPEERREPSRRGARALWLAGTAALIVAALLLTRPWETRRPAPAPAATPVRLAPTSAPAAESVAPQPTPAAVAPTIPAPPTAAPAEPTARPRITAPEASADRDAADQARRAVAKARVRAQSAGAATKAIGPYEAGRRAERDGERLLARKRFTAARAAFEKSAESFAAAESEALQSAKASVVPAPPSPVARPEPTHPPTAVAVVLPPTQPPVAAEPTRAPVPEQDRVREAIRRYEKAQSSLDADLYARVFPAADKARIREAFGQLRSQSVEISIQRIEMGSGGTTAVVYGFETRSFAPRVGSEQHVSGNRVFRLEKRGDSWVIVGLGT